MALVKHTLVAAAAAAALLVASTAAAAQRPHASRALRSAIAAAPPSTLAVWDAGDAADAVDASGARLAPPSWVASDPADSLYRLAREALTRGRYDQAAELFHKIYARFPNSAYAPDAYYWEAFALYRVGGTDALKDAMRALEAQRKRHPRAATSGDASALLVQIRSRLAARGDASAAERVAADARRALDACPGEEDDMRIAALNGLLQMDAESAIPILTQVLARRDACSEQLRKKAVFLVAQKRSDETARLLLAAAREDPSPEVREDAVFWLSQVGSEEAVTSLDSILRSSTDRELQEKAIFALSQHRSARAMQALRRYAEQPGAPEELRAKAVFWIGQAPHHSAEDVQFLRALYGKTDSDELREAIIQSIANDRSAEARRWLFDIALDRSGPVEARKQALFWAGQTGAPLSDLLSLYERMRGQQEMQEQLIFVYAQRNESAALDKLIEIARKDPDRELRQKAIFWLGQKHDPRVKQVLLDIINQ